MLRWKKTEKNRILIKKEYMHFEAFETTRAHKANQKKKRNGIKFTLKNGFVKLE